ncbi:MAG TPA: lamin tail domain-containing protein [Candidatus Thalassarchaeaceae archaeon]|nr:lamin tail domain-containing protein [Candidatus Thalassarchaeaceae archaeon]
MTSPIGPRLVSVMICFLFLTSALAGWQPNDEDVFLGEDEYSLDTSSRSTSCIGDVCISELLVNAFGGETDAVGPSDWTSGEWVEIHNSGTTTVDLSTWTLEDHSSRALPMTTPYVVYPSGATDLNVAGGDYIVMARNGNGGSCGLCLKNTNGVATLKDPSGSVVHSATWTSRPTEGVSMIQNASDPTANWIEASSLTPGGANTGGSQQTYHDSGIRVREIFADPFFSPDNGTWPGGEWLELENIGTQTVDLNGYFIRDASSNNLTINENHLIGFDINDPSSSHIQPGERRIVPVNASGIFGILNNGGDELKVYLPNGSITDELTYPQTRPGHSKVRSIDGLTWEDALFPTPGKSDALAVNGTSTLTINEIMVNATQNDATYPDGEWIEFRVQSNETTGVGLAGFEIVTGTGGHVSLTEALVDCSCSITSPHGLGPGDYGVVQMNGTGVEIMRSIGDSISLVDPAGDVVQTLTWQTSILSGRTLTPFAGDAANGWTLSSSPTPAAANPDQTSGTGGTYEVIMTEILPNPFGNDTAATLQGTGEFIEIMNNGSSSVDLTGWSIMGGATLPLDSTTTSDLNLETGEYAVIRPTDPSTFWLSNNGGSISLHDALGNPVNSLVYNTALPGAAMVSNVTATSWIYSSSPSPGQANPQFDVPYAGISDLVITEIMPQCGLSGSDSVGLLGEWIEVRNNGSTSIDLSRWHVLDEDGSGMLASPNQLWNRTTMILLPGEYAVLHPEEAFMDNFGDTIRLMNPDGTMIQSVYWLSSESCVSIEPRFGWWPTLSPSPGLENPIPQVWDGTPSIKFSRFMFEEVDSRGHDWFELRNVGTQTIDLAGWNISRQRNDADPWNDTFRRLVLSPGESAIITSDPSHLLEDAGIEAYGGSDVMYNMPWLPNNGGSFQLTAPDGTVVDAIAYDEGDPMISGWSGSSISPPESADTTGLILMRGDGCSEMPDTDTAADWEIRWLRMGASLFCDGGGFSGVGNITTSISPGNALGDLVNWIDQAQTEIHVHLYELTSPELSKALQNAIDRGVDVTILLEGGVYSSWDYMAENRGIASDLHYAGATVLWMVEPPSSSSPEGPYQYIHSKVAVRDQNSVWMSSGNWKSSSFPVDGDSGNREWSIFIDDNATAQMVLSRMLWDEDTSHLHIEEFNPMDSELGTPSNWVSPSNRLMELSISTDETTYSGPFTGQLLTCPDDCIGGLVNMIDSAEESIDLSVQYFQDGWGWGYGDNPLLESLERAAVERNVTIRLLLNGYYTDDPFDDRDVLNLVNNQWNRTQGADATAILMSNGENITKLHNKGVIIDGKSVLISSINWGSNSALRNREMGIILHQPPIASAYLSSFNEDWNRVDDTTDTDGDGMPDWYEIKRGLNRTSSIVPGSPLAEQSQDWDEDGLSNLQESNYDGDPFSKDTDGDCIEDAAELSLAVEREVSPIDAINKADADGDGFDDFIEFGCTESTTNTPSNNGDGQDTTTDDSDENDPGGAFGLREDPLDSTPAKILLGLVIISGITLGIALALMMMKDDEGFVDEVLEDDTGYVFSDTIAETSSPESSDTGAVILDGTSVGSGGNEARDATSGKDDGVFGAPKLDGFDFDGWTHEFVQTQLSSGWTMEQLREKYQEEFGE